MNAPLSIEQRLEDFKEWVFDNVPLILRIPIAIVLIVVCVIGTLVLPRRVWIKWWQWE